MLSFKHFLKSQMEKNLLFLNNQRYPHSMSETNAVKSTSGGVVCPNQSRKVVGLTCQTHPIQGADVIKMVFEKNCHYL